MTGGSVSLPIPCYCADHSQLSQDVVVYYVRLVALVVCATRFFVNNSEHFILPKVTAVYYK